MYNIQSQNSLIRYGFRQAAAMMNALLSLERFQPAPAERAVAVTSFGVTTPCVKRCVEWLEKEGYTPYVFTARGMAGGRLLERMIGENRFAAVLDITTSEVIDEIAGGIYAVPGCQRLTGAAKSGIPYVIAPGALEMVNLTAGMEQQPGRKGRVFYAHTEKMIKMRANRQEMEQAGELFAERLGKSEGNVCLCIPGKGFSEVNREGRVFFDPDADRGFVETVRRKLPGQVKIVEAPLHINDAAFAELLIEQLGTLLRGGKR